MPNLRETHVKISKIRKELRDEAWPGVLGDLRKSSIHDSEEVQEVADDIWNEQIAPKGTEEEYKKRQAAERRRRFSK